MTRGRKVLIMVGVPALALIAALVFVLTNINWIVKSAIEHYGSQAAGTPVRVATVTIRLAQGKGAIEGLTVANPKGFPSPHVLSLGSISVRIDSRTVASSPVVIDDVRISAPRIVYETNDSRTSNVDALKKNMESSDTAAPKRPSEDRKAAGKEKRIRIRRLMIENARVDVRVAGLADKPRTVSLRRIEMTDIGGKSGATPEQAARQVLTAIAGEVTREVAEAGAERMLQKGVERALQRLQRK